MSEELAVSVNTTGDEAKVSNEEATTATAAEPEEVAMEKPAEPVVPAVEEPLALVEEDPDPEIKPSIVKKLEVKEEPESDYVGIPVETPLADIEIKKEEELEMKVEIEIVEHNIEEDLKRGIKRRASSALSDVYDKEFKGFDETRLEVQAEDYSLLRTREPQPGGRVHVQDARGVAVGPLPAVVDDRGGPSLHGRGCGGFVYEQPGPHTVEELVVCDIADMPEGQGLETPLHRRRARSRPLSDLVRPAVATPPPAPSSSPAPFLSAPIAVPSPTMFVECDGLQSFPSPVQDLPTPPTQRRPSQCLKEDDIADILNYGSDRSTDESEDEDTIPMVIPRVLRSRLATPLDEEDAADDPVPADVPAPGSVPLTATDQPWKWHDFAWKEFPNSPISPELRRETFSQSNVGPTTPRDDPYDLFIDIWDGPIMEHIASETNKYAQQVAAQMLANNSHHATSRISCWFETTADELYCYFGIVLAMGLVLKSRLEEYWAATLDVFCTPGFSAHMSIDRFKMLSKCLHFNDNDGMCGLDLNVSEARLFKIQPILSHFNKKFQMLYTPRQNIALDESLLMWKGWLDIGQLIPNKAAIKGIKTYEICESQTGYLWRFEVHAHKSQSPPQQFEDPLDAPTPSIVLRLIQGLEHKGYTLWMSNFYNSPCLARRLKSLGIDCVGTVRTDRKFVPQVLYDLTKRNMLKGQVAGLTTGDVDAMLWRDNKKVAMISTYHGRGQQTVRGSTKPIVILDYNIVMGGLDKKDQILAMFPVERKRTRVWYKKLFRRLLNVSVLNAFVIYHYSSSLSHRNFRISLIKTLISKHRPPPIFPAITQNLGFDVSHRIEVTQLKATLKKNERRPRGRCVVCKHRVQTFCVGCSRYVCMKDCFLQLHS